MIALTTQSRAIDNDRLQSRAKWRVLATRKALMESHTPSLAGFVRRLLFRTMWVALALTAIYLYLAMLGLAPTPDDCITEVHGRISGVSGFDFEISETNCDTLAKTATISVFASKPGRPKKVLLFKFFPAYDDLLPVITPVDQHTVQISIPEISSLFLRRDKLKDLTVIYKIDVIDYPDSDADTNQR